MDALIDKVVTPLKEAKGIVDIVLGGSRVISDTHTKDSDYDIGIYQNENKKVSSIEVPTKLLLRESVK